MPQAPPVRLGIIGAGDFAGMHMEAFRKLPQVEVVAFCRRNADALAGMQRKWDVPHGFTDYRDLLAMDGLDAVAIVTPTDSHRQIALDAIAAGKHVLCEKPLALTASDAREMLDAAEAAGVVHATNFNQRGRTAVGRLKRYLDAGYVGRVFHAYIWWGSTLQHDARPDAASWRFQPEHGGGVLYELIHVFDMARFVCGDIKRLCSLLATHERRRPFSDFPDGMDIEVPDWAGVLIEFESGATGVIHISWVTRGLEGRERPAPRVEVSGLSGRIMTEGLDGLRGVSGEHAALAELDPGEPYPQPYEQFVNGILAGEPVETSFEAGLEAAKLVDAAIISAREQRWVEPG